MENTFRAICRFCKSRNVTKWCKRSNLFAIKQRWFCKNCKRTFTPDDGFLWKHYNPLIIVGALALYMMGLSENNIVHYFWQLWAVKFSTSTLFRWRSEYSTKVKRFVDRFKPEIKGAVHTDEVVVKIRKKKGWRWGGIDRATNSKFLEGVLNGEVMKMVQNHFSRD